MADAKPSQGPAARLQILAAACLFSTGGAAIKATSLTGWQVASFRSGVAALALLAFLPSARRGFTRRGAAVAVAYAATLTLFVLANKLTTSANAIYLQSTAPLYVALLAPLLLGEPTRRGDLAFMTALGAGLALIMLGRESPLATAPAPGFGNVVALGSGLAWAFTVVGLRWMAREEGTARGSAAAAIVMGNALAFAVGLPLALPLAHASPRDWALVAFLGVFQIGVAYALLSVALRRVGALEAALLLLTEPVLNPIVTWAVHGERPGAWSLAGGALILGATLVRSLRSAPPAPGP